MANTSEDERAPAGIGIGLKILLVVAVIALLVPLFVAKIFTIPSGSMEQTLHGCAGCANDRVLVDRLAYLSGSPERGDIVVFEVPDGWHSTELARPEPSSNAVTGALRGLAAAFGIGQGERLDFIKRVVAVGGQTVSCCDARNRLLVDQQPVDEPYLYFSPEFGAPAQARFPPVRVPEGQLWVMGDSRNNSVDSHARGNGPIPVDSVIGKARLIVLPPSRFGAVR